MPNMIYRKLSKYKYQLLNTFSYKLKRVFSCAVDVGWVKLNGDKITVKKGYCWDGASGPTVDTDNTMVPSLIHDALCQLIRVGKIDKKHQKNADLVLRDVLLDYGMTKARAYGWYYCVRLRDKFPRKTSPQDKIYTVKAP